MQLRIKQRLIGASVIFVIAVIFLPVLFYHPLPGMKKSDFSNEALSESGKPQLVYDLALHDQEKNQRTAEQDELVSSQPLMDSELRRRAAKTDVISARLLHAAPVPSDLHIKENLKDETGKTPSPTADATQPVTIKSTSAPDLSASSNNSTNSTRDLRKKQVSFQATTVSVPQAWVVQVGSFADKAHATELVRELRKMNLDTYVRQVNSGETALTTVFVGPYIVLDTAKSLQQKLQEKLHITSVIKKYTLS